MSTSSTIQNYYCTICDQITLLFRNILTSSLIYFEFVGSVRCAAELSRMGREKEAKNLLEAASKLREVRKPKV
jgi:hypothetical protein